MTTIDVLNCQFQSWYSNFKNITIQSHVLKLPNHALDFLKRDGITIPSGYRGKDNHSNEQETQVAIWMHEIDKSINKLEGLVFPKLNWSSPKDASWISADKTLKCRDAEEVVLLLKSSDLITHDLQYPFDECSDKADIESISVTYHLILRKWQDFTNFSELRCFVRNKKLIAICQRQADQYHASLATKRDSISADVQRFFAKHIENIFPSENYTFDVFRSDAEEIFLLDFNPFGGSTDALLFGWDELEGRGDKEDVEFRLIPEEACGIQPGEFAWNAVPVDFYHLAHGLDMKKFYDFLNVRNNQMNGEDSSSSDEADALTQL